MYFQGVLIKSVKYANISEGMNEKKKIDKENRLGRKIVAEEKELRYEGWISSVPVAAEKQLSLGIHGHKKA